MFLGCNYKHPHISKANFNTAYLSLLLEKLGKKDKLCVLMGNFNINLMNLKVNGAVLNLLTISGNITGRF